MTLSSTAAEFKNTPLYDLHREAGAKMVAFGGWMMPVSYGSVLNEHKIVRETCGIFDVSHMGEVRVKGTDARKFLQWLTINDIDRLMVGAGQYSAILNESGGMIDDLIIYRLDDDEFFICVNASNREQDYKWIKELSSRFTVEVEDESDRWAQIAVQGPKSLEVLRPLLTTNDANRLEALPYTHIQKTSLLCESVYIARTGYTGEFGFELYLPIESAQKVWSGLLDPKAPTKAHPIGLGARDTLRLEACYLLYGNDMNETVSPLEAGISWATKLDKGDFVGRAALLEQKSKGVERRVIAFKMIQDAIPRQGMKVFFGDKLIGSVTSGSVLPTVGGAGGMALIEMGTKEGDEITIEIRGQQKIAQIFKRPLYAARTK
jgi:aminomethyltransferase